MTSWMAKEVVRLLKMSAIISFLLGQANFDIPASQLGLTEAFIQTRAPNNPSLGQCREA